MKNKVVKIDDCESDPMTWKQYIQFTFHTFPRSVLPLYLDSMHIMLGWLSLWKAAAVSLTRDANRVSWVEVTCVCPASRPRPPPHCCYLGVFESTNVERHHLFTSSDTEQQAWCSAWWQSLARHLLVGCSGFSFFQTDFAALKTFQSWNCCLGNEGIVLTKLL